MKSKSIMQVIRILQCMTARIIQKTISRVEEFGFCSETASMVPPKKPDNINTYIQYSFIHKASHQSLHIWIWNTILFAEHFLRHFLSESVSVNSLMSAYVTPLVFFSIKSYNALFFIHNCLCLNMQLFIESQNGALTRNWCLHFMYLACVLTKELHAVKLSWS